MEILLAYSAEVNRGRADGFTPLICAVWKQDLAIVRLLLPHFPDLNARWTNPAGSFTALVLAHQINEGEPIARELWEHIKKHGLVVDELPDRNWFPSDETFPG